VKKFKNRGRMTTMNETQDKNSQQDVDMNIDFENYKVETDRALSIRQTLELLKSKNWIGDLKLLVTELGVEKKDDSEESPTLPGIKTPADQKITLYQTPEGHPVSQDLKIELSGTELNVSLTDVSILEVGFLPKENDYALFYVDEIKFPELENMILQLEDQFKLAKSKKNERQATWKKRFE